MASSIVPLLVSSSSSPIKADNSVVSAATRMVNPDLLGLRFHGGSIGLEVPKSGY
jgi:hypothetical protein